MTAPMKRHGFASKMTSTPILSSGPILKWRSANTSPMSTATKTRPRSLPASANGFRNISAARTANLKSKTDFRSIRQISITPISFFPEGTKRRIQSLKNNFENTYVDVNVILFNYTTSLERLLEWDGTSQRHTIQNYTGSIPKDISAIEHIHGFCDERARLAVGIDNKAQIANPVLAENPKICRRYVKDEFNSCYELGHAQRCAEWIDNADVICIYGMSLGESDQRWWDRVAKRLTVPPRPILFYFVHRDMELRGNNGPEYQEQVDEDRQYLMSRLGLLGRSDTTGLSTRIFVSYSPAIFTPRPSTF